MGHIVARVSPKKSHISVFTRTSNTASEADELVYGGELKAMGFKAELYQHDPHLRAVLPAPWTMVPVMNEPTEADSKSKSTSKVGLFSPKSKSKKSLV